MTDKLPLFHRAYGADLQIVPAPIRRLHDVFDVHDYSGVATVQRGDSLLSRLICIFMGFPPSGEGMPLSIRLQKTEDGERWSRSFADWPLETRFCAGATDGSITETLGALGATSRMDVDDEGVSQVLIGLTFLGIPLPRMLWPRLFVRESANGNQYRFVMTLFRPSLLIVRRHLLIHYEGSLDVGPETERR